MAPVVNIRVVNPIDKNKASDSPVNNLHVAARKYRIVVFIGNLASGGKERRLIELLSYFKKNSPFDFLVVMTKSEIHYDDFYSLKIPVVVLEKRSKRYDVSVFRQFYNICKKFRPQLIHSWGRIQTLYSIPTSLMLGVPILNSQITSAPPTLKTWSTDSFIDKINFVASKTILSNSQAGIDAYNPPKSKSRVIYNGINLTRFTNLTDTNLTREKYRIKTAHIVLMAASFSSHKDYRRFYQVAEFITGFRSDITFIGVGASAQDDSQFEELSAKAKDNDRILFPGRISDVESLINISTIGVLFSNEKLHGEGISNAVMEYMSLGKPVIANDAGGTKEIVLNNVNGYLIKDESVRLISDLIVKLIDDVELRERFGNESRKLVNQKFLLSNMGKAFEEVYFEILGK